jgi:hypothetical protein
MAQVLIFDMDILIDYLLGVAEAKAFWSGMRTEITPPRRALRDGQGSCTELSAPFIHPRLRMSNMGVY